MATLEYLVRAVDDASGVFRKVGLSADVLDRQLSDLSKKVATPTVDLNDKAAAKNLAEWAVKLDRLSTRVASPKITVEGLHRAQLDILKLDAQLDALNGKEVDVTIDVNQHRGIFSRVSGMAGAAGGAIGKFLSGRWQGTGGWASGAAGGGGLGAAGPFGIGALIAAAAALNPALVPFALGGAAGGGAAAGALALGSKAEQQLKQLQASLHSANQSVASAQRSLAQASPGQARANAQFTLNRATAQQQNIQGQIAALRSSRGPELSAFGALENVGRGALGVFNQAITARSPGFSGGPGGHPGSSFLTGLTAILQQVSGFVKSLGPGLGTLFRSSLPFVTAFVKIMERFAKIILPVATQLLRQFTPYLPLMTKGFVLLAKGLAGFLVKLGPGMKDSAIIFVAAAKVTMGLLQLLGLAVSYFAIVIVKTAEAIRKFARNVPGWFNETRHETAVIFDGMRHDIAHIWDVIFNNTIGAVIRIDRGILTWFAKLPGQIVHALLGLGSTLWHLGAGWVTSMWNGIRHIWDNVIGWFKGLPGSILHAIGIGSPPRWAISAGEWIMKGLHIGLSKASGLPLGLAAGIASRIGSALGHGTGATAGGIQALAYQIAKTRGWANQWGAIQAVEMAEAGWNLRARNPSSGAYGIAQFINGPSEYYQWGGNPNTAAGQIVAFYNYIASRYGTPAAAAAHEARFHWYGRGFDGIVNRPTIFGAGEAGPERVTVEPLSRSRRPGGAMVQFGDVNIYNATDEALVRQKLSYAIVAAGLGS